VKANVATHVRASSFDQSDQHLAGAFDISVCFVASELHLLTSDFGVCRDRCELSVNSLREIGDDFPEFRDIGSQLCCLLVSEDAVFAQRTGIFPASTHHRSFHPACCQARVP
jgi:hypothetical protein